MGTREECWTPNRVSSSAFAKSTRALDIVQRALDSRLTACNDAECTIYFEDHRVDILDVAHTLFADRLVTAVSVTW